jgi:molecular chaperone Hsp33
VRDVLLRGLLRPLDLRVIYVDATDLARMARLLHGLAPTSAAILAEGLVGGLLLVPLQKEKTRVNLHLSVDGPISGLLVDADTEGNIRGRVRGPHVHFPGDLEVGRRAALGGGGTLSVLRDFGKGEFYRGSVEVGAGTLTEHLRRYFAESEQVPTALEIRVARADAQPLGCAAGILVQKLPEGTLDAFSAVRSRLERGALALATGRGLSEIEVLREALGSELEVLEKREVAYRCACSRERAVNAITALGADGIRQALESERELVVDCEFCKERYVVSEAELRELVRRLSLGPGLASA